MTDSIAIIDAHARKSLSLIEKGSPATAAIYLDELLKVVESIRPEPERSQRDPEDYQTDLSGYDTVLGFLSKHDPFILEMMVCPVEETQRDGFWLMHRARERGLTSISVPAPKVVRDLYPSIETVKAWPVALLHERFGH